MKERKVLASLSLYGASSWLAVEASSTLAPHFGISEFWVGVLIYFLLAFFPVLLFYYWVLSHSEEEIVESSWPRFWRVAKKLCDSHYWQIGVPIVLFTFVAGGANFYMSKKDTGASNFNAVEDAGRIAVMHFQNLTGAQELETIGPMISHWLTDGFIENGQKKIISSSTVQRAYAANVLGGKMEEINQLIYEDIGAEYVVDGNYFLQHDSLFIKCHLVNTKKDEVVHSFGTFAGLGSSPIAVIEDLRQKVLGYWYTKSKSDRFPAPGYDAYKKYIEAQLLWGEGNTRVENLLLSSIALDDKFNEPHFLLLALKRNQRKWAVCDSMINRLYERKAVLTKAQLQKVHFFKNELAGKYPEAFSFLEKEYHRDEKDLFINTSSCHFSRFALNDLAVTEEMGKAIVLDSIEIESCHYCQSRLFILASAALSKGEYEKALAICKRDSKADYDQRVKEIALLSLVRLGNWRELDQEMEKIKSNSSHYLSLCRSVATEYLIIGEDSFSLIWVNKALEIAETELTTDLELRAQLLEMKGALPQALAVYEELQRREPTTAFYAFRIAGLYAQSEKVELAKQLADSLYSIKPAYDFGYTPYEAARIYLLMGNKRKSLELLKESVLAGRMFYLHFFDRDWYLRELWKEQEMKELLESRKIIKS